MLEITFKLELMCCVVRLAGVVMVTKITEVAWINDVIAG